MENLKIPHESLLKSYDIIFIGGGPSTLSFFCHLFKNRYIDRIFPHCKILILEKSERFGSGCLGTYGINTNTSAEGFLRLICPGEKNKNNKLTLSPNSKPMKPSKNYDSKYNKKNITIIRNKVKEKKESSFIPLKDFKEFFNVEPCKTLLKIGNRPAPLSLIGYYLDCLGNYIIELLHRKFGIRIFKSNCEVQSIKLLKTEEFTLSVKDLETNSIFNIRSKSVILASGARQKYNDCNNIRLNSSLKSFADIVGQSSIFYSDNILKKSGYLAYMDFIAENEIERIVIIGGSHSGFSCAWISLNVPVNYENIIDSQMKYVPKHLDDCHGLNDICGCFSSINDSSWKLTDEQISKIKYLHEKRNLEIIILYRDTIKVHYASEKDAEEDGYQDYHKKDHVNKNGNVFPFIGLRGDAKEIYRNIKKNQESRIKIIKADTLHEQISIIKEKKCVVVWACGYETSSIPIFQHQGNPVEMSGADYGGLMEVDKTSKLLDKNKQVIKNLFGIGQGYSVFSMEIVNGKKARADAINLYNTVVSKRLYKSLMSLFSRCFLESRTKVDIAGRSRASFNEKFRKEEVKSKNKNGCLIIISNDEENKENEKFEKRVVSSKFSENKKFDIKIKFQTNQVKSMPKTILEVKSNRPFLYSNAAEAIKQKKSIDKKSLRMNFGEFKNN